jgi:hypothetical protein
MAEEQNSSKRGEDFGIEMKDVILPLAGVLVLAGVVTYALYLLGIFH